MPELPEVETVRRTLKPAIGGVIGHAWTDGLGLHMGRKPPRAALKKLEGTSITALRRIGKYLLLDTSGPQSLLVHLGMTGRLRLGPKSEPRAPHTHVVLGLSPARKGGEARELRFVDARRFGQVDVVTRATEREHVGLAVLGPDPLTDGIDPVALHALAREKRQMLKQFVLDQSVIAGVGNIYASEALWRAKLRPSKRSNRMSLEATGRLAEAIHEVFALALDKGGTSLRDFVDAYGASGDNDEYLWVYDREGQPCSRCKTPIKRTVHQGRATYFCPTCQTP